MAIGNPTQVGTHAGVNTTGQTTLATASTCVIPANSLVVIIPFCANATVDPAVPTQVTDGTNTVTVADASVWISNAGRVSAFSWYDTAGRTATITVTLGAGGTNQTWLYVYTLSGAASTSWKDQTGTSSSASATTMAVTTAGNVAQADEVAFGVYGRGTNIAAPTTWPGAGWTALNGAAGDTDATRSKGFNIEYKNGLTAAATATADGTLSAATAVSRLIVTYKGAAAATVTPPRGQIVSQAMNRSYNF